MYCLLILKYVSKDILHSKISASLFLSYYPINVAIYRSRRLVHQYSTDDKRFAADVFAEAKQKAQQEIPQPPAVRTVCLFYSAFV